ncbi:MAG TPA: hypothetical protein ENJ57_05660 [Rhizobiales bacterium]|nr:hypothetical protein [Hyphomicrobiales bacterium]
MAKKDTASKPEPAPKAAKSTPPAKDPSQPEIADLHSELVKIADTLKAMKSTLQKQDARIGKLESVVGTVTGSIPAAKTPQTSSIQSKTEKTNTENQVNTAAKADLLAIATGKAKRLDPAAIPASSASAPQDTQDARTRHAPARIAALNTSTISRTAAPRPAIAATKVKAPVSISAKPRVQYAVKLARARSRGPLAAEWERLIRGKANELSVLEPQIMPAKTKSGESVLDLVAGPFNHMADAIELCARLKLKGIRCKQSRYGGKPL